MSPHIPLQLHLVNDGKQRFILESGDHSLFSRGGVRCSPFMSPWGFLGRDNSSIDPQCASALSAEGKREQDVNGGGLSCLTNLAPAALCYPNLQGSPECTGIFQGVGHEKK